MGLLILHLRNGFTNTLTSIIFHLWSITITWLRKNYKVFFLDCVSHSQAKRPSNVDLSSTPSSYPDFPRPLSRMCLHPFSQSDARVNTCAIHMYYSLHSHYIAIWGYVHVGGTWHPMVYSPRKTMPLSSSSFIFPTHTNIIVLCIYLKMVTRHDVLKGLWL